MYGPSWKLSLYNIYVSYIISDKTEQLLGLESCPSWWQTQVFCCCCWKAGSCYLASRVLSQMCAAMPGSECYLLFKILSFIISSFPLSGRPTSFIFEKMFIKYPKSEGPFSDVRGCCVRRCQFSRQLKCLSWSLGHTEWAVQGSFPWHRLSGRCVGIFTYPAHSTASPWAFFKKLFCFGKTAQWYPFVLLMNLSRFLKSNSDLTPKADLLPSSLDSSF